MVDYPEMVGASLLVLALVLWYQYRRNLMSTFKRLNIPGPEPHFIFGNLRDIFRKTTNDFYKECIQKHGKVFGYYFGASPVIVVADAETLRHIQIKDFQNFINRPELVPGGLNTGKIFNNHVIRARDQRWKNQRAVLTPSFTSGKMKQMNPIVQEAVAEFLTHVRDQSSRGQDFDIYAMYKALTLDVIGRAAFGIKTNVQKNPETDEFLLAVMDAIKEDSFTGLNMLGICLPELSYIVVLVRSVSQYIKNLLGHSRLDQLAANCEAIVKSRRANPKNRRQDLLQLMLDAQMSHKDIQDIKGESLTAGDEFEATKNEIPHQQAGGAEEQKKKMYRMNDDEVLSNTFIILFAGFDTTSNALGFTTHVLVNRPDIQEKIREEVKEVIQKDGFLDFTNVSRCKYLDQVLSESLRFYPPVPGFVSRETSTDIRYGDRTIPKGIAVQVPITIHRDPDYWQDPDTFDPERFSAENKKNHHPLAFQAFGAGPRNCIGMRFAQMEAKLTLANLLIKYRLEPGDRTETGDIEVRYKAVLMSPKNGVFVKAVPITE